MKAHQETQSDVTVQLMARALRVTSAGYWAYLAREKNPGPRAREDAALKPVIAGIFDIQRGRAGAPRIQLALNEKGRAVSRARIHRLMKSLFLRVKPARKTKHKTTDSRHSGLIQPNLLARDFESQKPNEKWVSDITYFEVIDAQHDNGRTAQKHFVYVCTITDLFSRRVIGFNIDDSISADLVAVALRKAIEERNPAPGCIFHSDRGSQYVSHAVISQLEMAGLRRSMSRRGDCYDNAPSESLFSRIKFDIGDSFFSNQEAFQTIREYLSYFHPYVRIHTTVRMTPFMKERSFESSLSLNKFVA